MLTSQKKLHKKLDKWLSVCYSINVMMSITSSKKLIMSEERESEVVVDFEDEDAIRSMIDFAMSIEEAEEELFDHYANEVI